MKKIVAFLMAFALCIACFGTYGFADLDCHDESHDHGHNHVVKAVDDDLIQEYLYINRKSTATYTSYSELTNTLRVTITIDSESLSKGRSGVLTITAPYYVLGKPSVLTGSVFGVDFRSASVTTTTPKPTSGASSSVQFSVTLDDNDPGFTQTGYVVLEYPVDAEYVKNYSWLRQAQINVSGYVVAEDGTTVRMDPSSSTYIAYICNHANVQYRVTKEATCQKAGEKERYCTSCNFVLGTEPILPTDHDLDFTKPFNQKIYGYQAPTCKSAGYGFFKCNECGTLINSSIPKLAHTFGERILLNGVYYYECKVCKEVEIATNQCPHDAEKYVQIAVVSESTCTNKGVARYQCPECKQVEERELPLADHKFTSSTITTAATCTTAGVKTSTCFVCKQKVTETIPVLGHDYGEWQTVTAATCIKDGVEAHYCSRCNATETRPVTGSGHNYGSWVTTVPASCVSNGTEVRVCSLCNQTQTQPIPMSTHTYGAWTTTTAATCVAPGVETRTCAVCNATDSRTINPIADNHKFGEWETVVAKTCVTDGEKSRTCELCNFVQTETDACTGHVLGDAVVDGKFSTKTCGVCGYRETIKTVKDGTVKTLSSASGALVLTGTEAAKNYTFELGVPSMETEAYYKQYLDFYKAYTFKVLVDGEAASVNDSMELTIATDPLLENYEISVLRLVGNSFYPINNFERDDGEVIIPGAELSGAEVIFVVKGEEASPNLVIPIVVTIVTVVIAGAAICIFMVKGKKKSSF